MALTHREARYVRARIEGKSEHKALLAAGFSPGLAKNPAYVVTDEMREEVERLQAALVENTLEHALVDAKELHENLSAEHRGDLAELYDADNQLLPIAEWPMWARRGGVEVIDEPNMVHSADGGGDSWDQLGRRIKVKAGSRARTAELLMKHKGVDAMVQQGTTVTNNNLMVVTAEKAREVMAAKKRLQIAEARENAQEVGETRTESSNDGAL
jgi:phage terminase small subunit